MSPAFIVDALRDVAELVGNREIHSPDVIVSQEEELAFHWHINGIDLEIEFDGSGRTYAYVVFRDSDTVCEGALSGLRTPVDEAIDRLLLS